MNRTIQLEHSLETFKKGLDSVVDPVKVTIGSRGRNVAISAGNSLLIANDAKTIADSIDLGTSIESTGAKAAKNVIKKTSDMVGGGRTATAILTQSIFNHGLTYIAAGASRNQIKKGIKDATKDVIENLKKQSKKVKSEDELVQLATISTEDEELGKVIAKVIYKIGAKGIVTTEDSDELSYEFVEGLKFDKGWIHPYLVTNDKNQAIYENVPVLVTDKKLSLFKDIVPVIQRLKMQGIGDLVIIADDIDGEALNLITKNRLMNLVNGGGGFNFLAIKAPGFGDGKKDWIEDIAATVGAEVVSDGSVGYEMAKLGTIKKIISTKEDTTLIGGSTKNHIKKLQERIESLSGVNQKMDQEKLEKRIANLSNAVAIIKVTAPTQEELGYKKLKVDDGINESKRALEEGIIPGGNCSFIHAAKGLVKEGKDDYTLGYNLLLKAIEAPLRQIVLNAEGSPDVVIRDLDTYQGYNADTNEMVPDMFKAGIVDSLKVARVALENAASTASLALTIGGVEKYIEDKK